MTVPPDALAKMQELIPEARLARRQHSADDAKVIASAQLTDLFYDLHSNQNCSITEIAKAAGLTYHSVSARIKSANNA